ncbi:MAG: hypothetical protein ACR2QQ_01650, partial [Gammaproteobacteria bacterium]
MLLSRRNGYHPAGGSKALRFVYIGLVSTVLCACAQQPTTVGPRSQPGAAMTIYAPEQHELYDGRFSISGQRIYQVGRLDDPSPWDHMGDDASNLTRVGGEIRFDVDEIGNAGSFRAELQLPEGTYVVEIDRF